MQKEDHPYTQYEGTRLWSAIKKAVRDLEENQDLELTTVPEYVIGYMCKVVSRRIPAVLDNDKPKKKSKSRRGKVGTQPISR